MGKKKRNHKQQNDRQTRLFHITVGAGPRELNTQPSLSLDHELRLVKAALLYADHATLCSISTTMLLPMLGLTNFTMQQKVDTLRALLPLRANDIISEHVATWDSIMCDVQNKQVLTPEQRSFLRRFETYIEQAWDQIVEDIEAVLLKAGFSELICAVQANLLNIKTLGSATPRGKPLIDMHDIPSQTSQEWTDRMMVDFYDRIAKAILDNKTYPLFDDMTGQFIHLAIQEARLEISDTAKERGKHTLLASALLERLPLFDNASVDEIIDIRRELDVALIRFRQAIIGFSDTMKHAAWDKDFPAEADHLFHKEVAPTILAIEEHVRSSRSLVNIVARVAKKPQVSGGVLSALLSPLAAVPELASLALIGGGTASAVLTTALEMREILKERQRIEQNHLYFYYRAGKLLEK